MTTKQSKPFDNEPTNDPRTVAPSMINGGTIMHEYLINFEEPVHLFTRMDTAIPKNAISKQFAMARIHPALLLKEHATPIRKPSTKL
jgi:hypothetical protein